MKRFRIAAAGISLRLPGRDMEEDSLLWTKFQLRRSISGRLKAVAGSQLQDWSADLAERLQERDHLWETPGTIALFGGLRDEPDLISFFLPWVRERGWRTVLFRIEGTQLLPFEVTRSADLERGPLGAWVPVKRPEHEISVADLTLILVPGLAFGATDGSRLGRGGGYFDRLLGKPEVTARRVGVAFETQVIDSVPCEPHDARVHELVTEVQWREF